MNVFYYFTGTGNTLDVARQMGEVMEDTKLIRITKDVVVPEILYDADVVGIFSPTYMGSAPSMVKDFLGNLRIKSDCYVFTVVTCGGMEIATHKSMENTLKQSGCIVSANFTFNCPANNQTSYAPTSKEQAIQVVNANKIQIKEAVYIVNSRGTTPKSGNKLMDKMIKALEPCLVDNTSISYCRSSCRNVDCDMHKGNKYCN